MVAWLYQAPIEAEATEVIETALHERCITRTTRRNGTRTGKLSPQSRRPGTHDPQASEGQLFSSVLEPCRRIDQARLAVVMEAYVHGVSTRKVEDRVHALSIDAGVSKSEVSRICVEMGTELEAFPTRPLDHVAFPCVSCDANYVTVRVAGRVVSRAVVGATGERKILGLAIGDSEDRAFWTEFLRSLRERSLHGVELDMSDHHLGLKGTIAKVFVGDSWQRGRVHVMRNVLAKVPRT